MNGTFWRNLATELRRAAGRMNNLDPMYDGPKATLQGIAQAIDEALKATNA